MKTYKWAKCFRFLYMHATFCCCYWYCCCFYMPYNTVGARSCCVICHAFMKHREYHKWPTNRPTPFSQAVKLQSEVRFFFSTNISSSDTGKCSIQVVSVRSWVGVMRRCLWLPDTYISYSKTSSGTAVAAL